VPETPEMEKKRQVMTHVWALRKKNKN
jgi:hypothetical protein